MADTQEQLLANFDKALLRFSTFRDNHRVVVSPDTVTKLLSFLKGLFNKRSSIMVLQ